MVLAQAVMMTALFLISFAAIFSRAGTLDVRPIKAFGPPTASAPRVKPD
jgi:hypothetical protein